MEKKVRGQVPRPLIPLKAVPVANPKLIWRFALKKPCRLRLPEAVTRPAVEAIASYIRYEFYSNEEEITCNEANPIAGKRRLRLLTNREYEKSVRDIFSLSSSSNISGGFSPETKVEGFQQMQSKL